MFASVKFALWKGVNKDKIIKVTRQHASSGNLVIGTCNGDFNKIRELVIYFKLKLDDVLYLKAIEEFESYEMFIEENEEDSQRTTSVSNTRMIVDNGLEGFYNYVSSRGFNFSRELLINYIFSLKTKPFVILSGISGTGKTKIAQLFAEYMCPDEEIEEVSVEEEDAGFIYKVPKYFIKYSRLMTNPV